MQTFCNPGVTVGIGFAYWKQTPSRRFRGSRNPSMSRSPCLNSGRRGGSRWSSCWWRHHLDQSLVRRPATRQWTSRRRCRWEHQSTEYRNEPCLNRRRLAGRPTARQSGGRWQISSPDGPNLGFGRNLGGLVHLGNFRKIKKSMKNSVDLRKNLSKLTH